MILGIVLIIILLLILASCLKIVPQAHAYVIERLGAYQGMICPLSSRQVKYLKVSDKNTYISFWSVGIFMHTISLYIF